MEQEKKSFLEKFNSKWVTPFFAIITIIYGFFFKITNDKLDENSKILKNTLQQQEIDLRQKEFNNNLKLKVYEEVKEAIASKDSSIQNATLFVVNQLLKDDSLFRDKLMTLLFATPHSKSLIETQKRLDEFGIEQKEVSVGNVSQNHYRIDVFYLQDIPKESIPLAKSVVTLLKQKYPQNDIRLRELPLEVNAQRGYRIGENQIRYESEEEQAVDEVLKIINEKHIFRLEKPKKLLLTRSKSPQYFSLFIRNM